MAVALALLSWSHSAAWTSEAAVWQRAQQVSPTLPDPWIWGARALLDAPGDRRDVERFATAEGWLRQARAAVPQQSPLEQRWALDAIAATTAAIRLRQGRLFEAGQWMRGGMPLSARGRLCARFPSVCALPALSGSS